MLSGRSEVLTTDEVGCPVFPGVSILVDLMAHLNGDIGMQLTSCGTFRYAYADTFGISFA